MSLSKQLLILISLIFLIVFTVSFVLSIGNIRDYIEVESESHVQNTATSLGLSLSPHMVDEHDPIILTMMNAIFDMGYYKEMRLDNVDGEELIHLDNPEIVEGVPTWLTQMFPMQPATAVSEISSGWNISGTLYVTTNPAYAYLKLYEQAKLTFFYSLLFFIGAFILLMLVLRLTLKPLGAIQQQANEISAGNFVTLSQLPWTTEVRSVATSMNSMSQKIGDTITRLNTRLDELGNNLKRDSLTGLYNQASFNEDLESAESDNQKGYLFYIKVDELAEIAKDKGNETVDNLLKDLANLLQQLDENVNAYRLYGSEFALLVRQDDKQEADTLSEQLRAMINQLAQQYEIPDMVHGGIVNFEPSSDFNALMPALYEAYEQAKLIGHNAFYLKQDMLKSRSDQEWKTIVSDSIADSPPELTLTTEAFNYQGEAPVKVMDEAFAQVKDKQGNPLPIGTFFSMAQEFGMAEQLDRCIVKKVIELIEKTEHHTPITINLSAASVASKDFQAWLEKQLQETLIDRKLLVFTVTAYAAAKDLSSFTNFCHFTQELGAHTMLKRYAGDLIEIDALRHLHIDYIRLARDLTHNIEDHVGKQDFLHSIQEVSHLLEIKVLAESVVDDKDFDYLTTLNIHGISR